MADFLYPAQDGETVYPDSDGHPMTDDTLHFEWIARIKNGLDICFRTDPDVFVAANLLWYPVRGRPDIREAPDVMVALGRPKGHRHSYQQWREEAIAPQVVFEVCSRRSRFGEMLRKLRFYEQYGVEEFYICHPEAPDLEVWVRQGSELLEQQETNGWVSPRLGIRFDLSGFELRVLSPDGRPFLSYVELLDQVEALRREPPCARGE